MKAGLYVALCAAVVAAIGTGCAAKRFLGFGGDGTLFVRHHESSPQKIWLEGDLLGVADSGAVVCFTGIRTGTLRVEARAASDDTLTRATSLVLPPEQARLWDIDHDQVLEGRAFRGSCE